MRLHARVEQHIARIKDSGGQRFPFQELAANQTWLTLVTLADNLAVWFQRLCLKGTRLERARPKTMRRRLVARPRPDHPPAPAAGSCRSPASGPTSASSPAPTSASSDCEPSNPAPAGLRRPRP